MKRLKVFLTGGSGFIGRNILEELSDKYTFIAPNHKKLDLLNTKSVDKFFLKNKFFDVVVHSAFLGGPRNPKDSPETLYNNLRIFFNIEKNKMHFGKLINLGSGAEYGKQRPISNISEKEFGGVIPLYNDYYGLAKYIIGKYIENNGAIINLRLFGVFGAYEDSKLRFISNAICKSILGLPITIRKNVFFEYLYVKDFVRILDYFISHKPKYHIYNVGCGKAVDLFTLANIVNRISGKKSPIKIKAKNFANEYSCNTKLLKSDLPNFNYTDLEAAISELYQFYLKRKKGLRKKDFID